MPLDTDPSDVGTTSLRRKHRSIMPVLARCVLSLAMSLVFVAGGIGVPAHAAVSCGRLPRIVLVHDFATGGAAVAQFARAMRATGRCVDVAVWGTPSVLRKLGLLTQPAWGGTDAFERGATDVSSELTAFAGDRPIDVVGVGAGALVARRALQVMSHPPRVRVFAAVGPMWSGTNLAGLGDLDQLSRDAGTYDQALVVEKLLLDPACAGCRDVIAHSDFLARLWAAGLRLKGARQVNIVSRTDLLVTPWQSGLLPFAVNTVVQDVDPHSTATHYQLLSNPTVRRLLVAALR